MNGNTRVGANLAFISVGLIAVMAFVSLPASADRYSSSNYIIDASTMNTFGGTGSSTSYGLVSSGGEAVIGNGAGGSYKLGQGYVAQLEEEDPSLSLFVQPSGLVGYWAFDENTGTNAFDTSANTNEIALQNTPSWTTGKVGSALILNGSNQYGRVINPTDIPDTNGIKTISAWFKTTTTSDKSIVGLYNTAGSLGIHVRLSGSGEELQAKVVGGARLAYGTVADANDGQWHHVAYTYNGSQHKLYFDGGVIGSSSIAPSSSTTTVLCLGCYSNGTTVQEYWSGSLDEIKIYSRALTVEEVQAEYNAQIAASVNGVFIGSVVPGVSNTALYEVVTVANTTGYTLAANQDADLTQGANTIPAISGSIGTPLAWSEGATKGLGFTLVSGSSIPGSWNSGNSYAAFPGSATTFYTRTGYTPGTKDVLGMRLRLDVATTQPSGDYDNAITITGTTTP